MAAAAALGRRRGRDGEGAVAEAAERGAAEHVAEAQIDARGEPAVRLSTRQKKLGDAQVGGDERSRGGERAVVGIHGEEEDVPGRGISSRGVARARRRGRGGRGGGAGRGAAEHVAEAQIDARGEPAVRLSTRQKKLGDARVGGDVDFLHASVVQVMPRAASEKGTGGGKTSCMPTARELNRSGVRISPGEDGRAAVEFDETAARLRLPALVYDFKLATVARNLLAREYEEQSKPVTRYFQMMHELVEEAADSKILRRAGAVRGGGTSGAEVHDLIKRIDGHATYPSVFMAMDVQIEKANEEYGFCHEVEGEEEVMCEGFGDEEQVS